MIPFLAESNRLTYVRTIGRPNNPYNQYSSPHGEMVFARGMLPPEGAGGQLKPGHYYTMNGIVPLLWSIRLPPTQTQIEEFIFPSDPQAELARAIADYERISALPIDLIHYDGNTQYRFTLVPINANPFHLELHHYPEGFHPDKTHQIIQIPRTDIRGAVGDLLPILTVPKAQTFLNVFYRVTNIEISRLSMWQMLLLAIREWFNLYNTI